VENHILSAINGSIACEGDAFLTRPPLRALVIVTAKVRVAAKVSNGLPEEK